MILPNFSKRVHGRFGDGVLGSGEQKMSTKVTVEALGRVQWNVTGGRSDDAPGVMFIRSGHDLFGVVANEDSDGYLIIDNKVGINDFDPQRVAQAFRSVVSNFKHKLCNDKARSRLERALSCVVDVVNSITLKFVLTEDPTTTWYIHPAMVDAYDTVGVIKITRSPDDSLYERVGTVPLDASVFRSVMRVVLVGDME